MRVEHPQRGSIALMESDHQTGRTYWDSVTKIRGPLVGVHSLSFETQGLSLDHEAGLFISGEVKMLAVLHSNVIQLEK